MYFSDSSVSLTGPCEPLRWTFIPNRSKGGRKEYSATTLSSCQSVCVANSGCTGIGWRHRSRRCFVYRDPWSYKKDMWSYTSQQDYYALTRENCNGNVTPISPFPTRFAHDVDRVRKKVITLRIFWQFSQQSLGISKQNYTDVFSY